MSVIRKFKKFCKLLLEGNYREIIQRFFANLLGAKVNNVIYYLLKRKCRSLMPAHKISRITLAGGGGA